MESFILLNNSNCQIEVKVTGFTNTDGELAIAVFNNSNAFENKTKAYIDSTTIITQSELTIILNNIDPGNYAISVFNDEDENGNITFGSLNNFMKVNEEVLDVWIKILKNIKNSKIILKSSLYICEDAIRKKFEKEGLKDSIQILKKTRRNEFLSHINVYDKIDICLDTFPFNGVTTTIEALWKNVPVLTRAGYNFNSRCGYSIIKNSNYDNLISYNQDEYIEKAVYYYNNRRELSELKTNLFNKILLTPLFQTKNFSKNLEKSLLNLKKNNLN